MRIRKAKPSDIKECVKIHMMNEEPGSRDLKRDEILTAKGLRKTLKDKDSLFLIAEGNGIIGYITMRFDEWNNSAYIEQLFIKLGMQGHGFGSQLLKAALEKAKNTGIRIVFLDTRKTNNRSIEFYKKNGFSVAGYITELYNEKDGKDALIMSYKIK